MSETKSRNLDIRDEIQTLEYQWNPDIQIFAKKNPDTSISSMRSRHSKYSQWDPDNTMFEMKFRHLDVRSEIQTP
jgi:hypothetical protein